MLHFKDHAVADIQKQVTKIIKRHKTIASATQEILLSIACEIETNQDTSALTQFISGLSTKDKDGKIVLNSTARSVGVYMGKVLPVKWDKKTQSFGMKVVKDENDIVVPHDYKESFDVMSSTRWDTFEKKKADEEFQADKMLAKAISILKSIKGKGESGDLQQDDPALVKATHILKAVA